MDNFQKEFIGLIRTAFMEQPFMLTPNFDWEKAVVLAKKHNIASVVFYGASNCNVPQDSSYMHELTQLTLHSAITSAQQLYEIERIQEAFEQAGIDYMPLKGAVIKPQYPKPEMRTMGDADILIQLDQYPQIRPILEQLGYEFKFESDHELVWQSPSLFLELHKCIMTSHYQDFYSYFGSGWKIAKPIPGTHRYEMSAEDFYLYIFVHFTKHYRIAGIGINHLLDLWVFANTHPDLNWQFIENELAKMHLCQFHMNVRKTINVWFHNESATDITDLITNVIFHSGQYGTSDMALVNRALHSGNNTALKIKSANIFQAVFLPYADMKQKYTILTKIPVLLPIMWIIRFFDVLIHQKVRLKLFMRKMKELDSKQVNDNQRALHAVGLDFHSGPSK